MKKLFAFLLVIGIALCTALGVDAKTTAVIDDKKPVGQAIDNGNGTFTYVYDVIIKTTEGETLETAEIKFAWKDGVEKLTCTAVDNWQPENTNATASSVDCKFVAASGQTGSDIKVGQITVVKKDQAGADCTIEYTYQGATGKINPPTGSNVSYIIVGVGVVAAVAAYVVSKKRSKLYNL